jgi:hypothetical protein
VRNYPSAAPDHTCDAHHHSRVGRAHA